MRTGCALDVTDVGVRPSPSMFHLGAVAGGARAEMMDSQATTATPRITHPATSYKNSLLFFFFDT